MLLHVHREINNFNISPSANCDCGNQESRVAVHLAGEVGFFVGKLIKLGFEVDVCAINDDISVKLSGGKPGSSEVFGQVTTGLDKAGHILRIDCSKNKNTSRIKASEKDVGLSRKSRV